MWKERVSQGKCRRYEKKGEVFSPQDERKMGFFRFHLNGIWEFQTAV